MNERVNIATKELIPVVMAGALWGKHWEGEIVNCRCDNKAVVAVLKSRTSKDSNLNAFAQMPGFPGSTIYIQDSIHPFSRGW